MKGDVGVKLYPAICIRRRYDSEPISPYIKMNVNINACTLNKLQSHLPKFFSHPGTKSLDSMTFTTIHSFNNVCKNDLLKSFLCGIFKLR